MQLTTKIQIYPTPEQIDVLWSLSECSRCVYNIARSEMQECWKNKTKYPSAYDQFNKLPELKKQYPELKVGYSKVLQEIIKKMHSNYHSFMTKWKNGDKTARPPNFKGRNYFVTLTYNQSGFKIENNTVTFSHKVNEIPLTFEIDNINTKVKQIEIFNDDPYKAKGKFFISITYDVDLNNIYIDNNQYQAIDLGITKIVTAINFDGNFFEVKTLRNDKYWNPKIDTAKSRRDQCLGAKKGQKKSKKYLRINNVVKKMSRKLSNQNKDFQHKLSRKMVDNTKSNTIIVGDLKVKNMAKPKYKDGVKQKKTKQKKGQNRSTQGLGNLSRFVEFLTYKAEIIGKRVIKIDESNTSKCCCICNKKHDMPTDKRIMSCDCGNVIDRDRNSAINIMIRFLSQNALWTSYQHFVDNLRKTGTINEKAHISMLSR